MKRLLLLFALFSISSPVRSQTPVGSEFQVNSYTLSFQAQASVAMNSEGDFMVVWESDDQDGYFRGIFGQRFAADGASRGAEFQVNTYTTFAQYWPAVAVDGQGNFVVAWSDYGQGTYSDVFGQRIESDNSFQGGEFPVNSATPGWQSGAEVAKDADGDFVVVWNSFTYANGWDVRGRLFYPDGTPHTSEFQVNTYTFGGQSGASVAMAPDGSFVAAWATDSGSDHPWDVIGQRFDANGSPIGGEFLVNSYTAGDQVNPSIASDAEGNFVIAWRTKYRYGTESTISGRRFGSDGSPLGSEFLVHTYTAARQPSVAMDADGDFVVVWESEGDGDVNGIYGTAKGVFGQFFTSSATRWGEEFHVNTYTTGRQGYPSVSMDAGGDFVVVWQSDGQDGSYSGVFGQRFMTLGSGQLPNELIADFGSSGVWHYENDWAKLSSWDPVNLVSWQNKLVAAFGSGRGLWLYDASGWNQITTWDPVLVMACGDKLAAAFAPDRGLWIYESTGWTRITPWVPFDMVCVGDKVVAAFDSGRGVWSHDGIGWSKLTDWEPQQLQGWDEKLVVPFGLGRGLWQHDPSGWTKLTSWDPVLPELVVPCNGKLAVAFGSGRGVWIYDSIWTRTTTWDPYQMTCWGSKLAVSFDAGRGLWLHDTSGWNKLTSWEPEATTALARGLVGDFGSGRGIWLYNGNWMKKTDWDPEDMEAADIYLGAQGVISGAITDWAESGPVLTIGDGVNGVHLWWSLNTWDKGYFYGSGHTGDSDVAHAAGVTDINQITDASGYTFESWYVGPLCDRDCDPDGVGEFIVWRNTDGYYGALRIDNIYRYADEDYLSGTWWFQTKGTPNLSPE